MLDYHRKFEPTVSTSLFRCGTAMCLIFGVTVRPNKPVNGPVFAPEND